jgi:hypothetical protein
MKKKILIATIVVLAIGGLTFESAGGMGWLESSGLLGRERQLQAAVHGYWQARVEDDLTRMADYVHPLQQEMYDPGLLKTVSYQVGSIAVEGDAATATIEATFRLDHPSLSHVERTKTLAERWVRHEGSWYKDNGKL